MARVPARLDRRLAGDGVQNVVARALRLDFAAARQLFADLLDSGGGVAGVHVRGDGAYHIVRLADRLYLKAKLREKPGIFLDDLRLVRRQMQRYGDEQSLRHDLALLRLERIENHALVRCVLVDKNEFVILLDNYVGL